MPRTRLDMLLSLFLVLILVFTLTGCSDDDNPASPAGETAPVLPETEALNFNFSFFDAADDLQVAKTEGEYDNFINAYLRVTFLDLVAHLVLAPPVTAFGTALHTPPSLQDDGSWIWVYTHVDGAEEVQIRLRGLPVDDGVEWEMIVTFDDVNNEVWFAGTTHDDGDTGSWTFFDVENAPSLAVAEISWGEGEAGRFLLFEVLAGDDDGDTLEFTDGNPRFAVDHLDASTGNELNIIWWADGHGSLVTPEYNEGALACWDTDYLNVVCE